MKKNTLRMFLSLLFQCTLTTIVHANTDGNIRFEFKCYGVENDKGVTSYTVHSTSSGNCDLSFLALPAEDSDGNFSSYTLKVNETELTDTITFNQYGWQEAYTKNKTVMLKQGENVITFISAGQNLPQIKDIRLFDGQKRFMAERNALMSLNHAEASSAATSPAPRMSDIFKIPYRPGVTFDVPYSYTFSLPIYLTKGESVSFYAPTTNDPAFGQYESTVDFNLYFFYNKPGLYSESKTSKNKYLFWEATSVPCTGVYYLLVEAQNIGEKGGVTLRINRELYRYSIVSNRTQPIKKELKGIEPHDLGDRDSYYNLFTINARAQYETNEADPSLWLKKLSKEYKDVIKDGKPSTETVYKYVIMDYNDNNSTPSGFAWGKNARIRTLLPDTLEGIPENPDEHYGLELYNVSLSASNPIGMENDTCDLYHSFWTSMEQDYYLLKSFPNLKWEDVIVTGAIPYYNCYAFAAGINDDILSPSVSDNAIEWFDKFYGNEEVANWRYNKHFKRPAGSLKYTREGATEENSVIDLWGIERGDSVYYTHASIRRNSDGIPHGYDWESKCGQDLRIFHPRYALGESSYGKVVAHYRIADNQNASVNQQIVMEEAIADGELVVADAGLTIWELQSLSEIKQAIPKEKQEELEAVYTQWKSRCDNHRYSSYLWSHTQCSEYNNLLRCLNHLPNSEYILYDKFVQNDFLSILPIGDMALTISRGKSALWNSIIDAPYQEGVIKTSQYNVTLFIKSILNKHIIPVVNKKENDATHKINVISGSSLITVEAEIKTVSSCSIHIVDLKTNSFYQLLPEKQVEAGTYTFSHQASPGFYLVTYTINGYINSKKIVVL